MATNVLLCRWTDGWREVKRQSSIDAIGRREAFLSLGAIETTEEVDRVANMQLDVVANPRMAIATDLAPMGAADRPYFSFNVGDTVGVPDYGTGTISQRVRALTGSEDDNGEITYSPELGDLILEEQERTLQAVKKMSDGTLEGDSPVAQPRLRTQIQQIWKPPAPFPSGGAGLRIVSTRPEDAYSGSDVLRSVPGGDGDYTLTSFRVTPDADGGGVGSGARLEFWQHVPGGDGDFEAARVDLGNTWQTGVVYVGPIFDSSITFAPEWGVSFRSGGDFVGSMFCEALFEGTGGTLTVAWDVDPGVLTVGP